MIFIDQATLTATPYLGQYKDIDSIFDGNIKVQGYNGINADGTLGSAPTTVTGDLRARYLLVFQDGNTLMGMELQKVT